MFGHCQQTELLPQSLMCLFGGSSSSLDSCKNAQLHQDLLICIKQCRRVAKDSYPRSHTLKFNGINLIFSWLLKRVESVSSSIQIPFPSGYGSNSSWDLLPLSYKAISGMMTFSADAAGRNKLLDELHDPWAHVYDWRLQGFWVMPRLRDIATSL